jgi:hypothetical protein
VKAIFGLLMAATMLLAACDDGAVEEPTAGTTETTTTTTTTAASTTTSTATPATTTTRPETSTTATPVPSDDFEALVARVEAAGEPESSRMEGSQEFFGLWTPLGVENLTLRFSATRDGSTGNTSFSMNTPSFGGQGALDGENGSFSTADLLTTIEVRGIGDTSYIDMGSLTPPDAQGTWISLPREQIADIEELARVPDPARMLAAYREADAQVEDVERETVNGVGTTHYAITVDFQAPFAEMSDEERAELDAKGPVPTGVFPLDLWISDEGYLVRMVMETDGYMLYMPDGGGSERMILTIDVFDIGQPIAIEAPPASEVTPSDKLFGGFDSDLEG